MLAKYLPVFVAKKMILCHKASLGFLESFRHIEIEKVLLVDHVPSEVQPDVHAGLHFYSYSCAEVRQHAFYFHRIGTHESASSPYHEAKPVQHFLDEVALVCIDHLAVFGNDYMRCFVAVLPHVVSS